MNKNYLILGSSVIAALATGATGGYFVAKKKFDATVEQRIAEQVRKTEKFYAIRLMEAKAGKPDSPADLVHDDQKETDEEPQPTENELRIIADGTKAMIDYRGAGEKPKVAGPVESNIFAKDKAKRPLPPRDPETGHFLPRKTRTESGSGPYIISDEEFLVNEPENDQENLLYFVNENTLVQMVDQEVVEIERVGEDNLKLFPQAPKDERSSIMVRNDNLGIDYDITRTYDNLAEFMGLDPDGEELPEDDEGSSSRWSSAMRAAQDATAHL